MNTLNKLKKILSNKNIKIINKDLSENLLKSSLKAICFSCIASNSMAMDDYQISNLSQVTELNSVKEFIIDNEAIESTRKDEIIESINFFLNSDPIKNINSQIDDLNVSRQMTMVIDIEQFNKSPGTYSAHLNNYKEAHNMMKNDTFFLWSSSSEELNYESHTNKSKIPESPKYNFNTNVIYTFSNDYLEKEKGLIGIGVGDFLSQITNKEDNPEKFQDLKSEITEKISKILNISEESNQWMGYLITGHEQGHSTKNGKKTSETKNPADFIMLEVASDAFGIWNALQHGADKRIIKDYLSSRDFLDLFSINNINNMTHMTQPYVSEFFDQHGVEQLRNLNSLQFEEKLTTYIDDKRKKLSINDSKLLKIDFINHRNRLINSGLSNLIAEDSTKSNLIHYKLMSSAISITGNSYDNNSGTKIVSNSSNNKTTSALKTPTSNRVTIDSDKGKNLFIQKLMEQAKKHEENCNHHYIVFK